MKLFSIILSFTLLANISNQRSSYFIPKEFEFPDDSIGNGKTFFYKNEAYLNEDDWNTENASTMYVENMYTFKNLQLINIDGEKYRQVKEYDHSLTSITDSIIILDGKALAVFNFFMSGDGKAIAGEKIQDTVIEDENKLGKHLVKRIYHGEKLTHIVSSEEKFLKDTIITWKKNKLPCLVTRTTGLVKVQTNADTSFNYTFKVFSNTYYAKGIGEIKYSIDFIDHTGKDNYAMWDLISIYDSKKIK